MPSESPSPAYDKERWMRFLELLAKALGPDGPPVQLCLIGSAVCLLGNMPQRSSRDLDIWKPTSSYDTLELKSAAEKDIQDILYLLKAYQPNIAEIKSIIHSFPEAAKAQGIENLVFLEVVL